MIRHKAALLMVVAALTLVILSSGCLPKKGAQGNIVKVKGHRGSWFLEVNGEPFYIKGVGCGRAVGTGGEDFLRLAKEMGANAVRTWGIGEDMREYLDTAHGYDLMVDAGIWLSWTELDKKNSYIGDSEYKRRKKQEIIDCVKEFKDHSALLMWNIGNEAFFFAKNEEEKVALAEFLEEITKMVHELDPDHPVIYTSADTTALSYIKKYVPSLDVFGMNIYGSIRRSHGEWNKSGLNIPYIVTEYGPYGPWDVRRDPNGAAIEPPDQAKAAIYRNMTNEITGFKGYDLGGFVFHMGDTTQESLTWWNLNYKMLKKSSFWTMYKIYTGQTPVNVPPRIKRFTLSKINGIKPAEPIGIYTEVVDNEGDSVNYEFKVSTAKEGILEHYVNEEVPAEFAEFARNETGAATTLIAPSKPGLYRVYVFVSDGKGNAAVTNKSIKVGQ